MTKVTEMLPLLSKMFSPGYDKCHPILLSQQYILHSKGTFCIARAKQVVLKYKLIGLNLVLFFLQPLWGCQIFNFGAKGWGWSQHVMSP